MIKKQIYCYKEKRYESGSKILFESETFLIMNDDDDVDVVDYKTILCT